MQVRHLPALTGVRILAALWVVLVHFRFEMYGLFPGTQSLGHLVEAGYLGVEMFFILSGFIISHNYASRFHCFDWGMYRRFILKRIARLYPVHLVTLLGLVAMLLVARVAGVALNAEGKHDTVSFVMNVFLLQAVPPAFSWNAPAWSISAEFGAYMFFPLVAFAVMRAKSRTVVLLWAAVALLFTIGGLHVVESFGDFSATSYPSMWLRISGEFAAGCFLWKFWSDYTTPGVSFDRLAILGLAGATAVLLVRPGFGADDFWVLPFIGLFVLGCAGATGPVARFLSHPWMDYGGRISYSLYMVHVVVQMVGRKFLPWESFADSSAFVRAVVLAAYFVAALLGAALLYHLVEEPGRRLIQRVSARKGVAPSTR